MRAIRNEADLDSLSVPNKYKKLGDFHKYYAGEKKAPILTLVIGGNHEASNFMWELYYGGWLAPNIYYLGAAGCVEVAGLTIAACSGIYNARHYKCGRFERQPYSRDDVRSVYHVRQFDVTKLGLLRHPDIFLSHDWPNGVEQYGDVPNLLRRKPFFRDEVLSFSLGSPPLQALLRDLKPRFWFSAHLHVRFAATVTHGVPPCGLVSFQNTNPEALPLDDDDDEFGENDTSENPPHGCTTEFLALGKCGVKNEYLHLTWLQFIDISAPEDHMHQTEKDGERPEISLRFHRDWLSITRATHKYFSLQRHDSCLQSLQHEKLRANVQKERAEVDYMVQAKGSDCLDVRKVQSFTRTAPTQGELQVWSENRCPYIFNNPQTEAFCELVQIPNLINTQHLSTQSLHRSRNISAQSLEPNTSTATNATDVATEIAQIRAAALDRKRKRKPASVHAIPGTDTQ
ncbi:hypothetical protein MGL_1346 [Malassezia globosa CBS 7966]|uniref:Lariat debranching enzyme C-terminal domain-containing protein n=1 Tax=Malassezia globosa (strain ATCC MYA-4612 / CBS 7966) TaxID=425265 RepID=A8PX70_MALGO|nr:uncharacterized protein MGL_1346 [Malassezia globosa CBS 7966]EDP43949.1 hypothetical protein MGL_1346 [Malassezia globosa CBS 7966]